MKPRLTKKKIRVCENPNGSKTNVLDMIFKQGDERVQIFVKDIYDIDNLKYIKRVIEDSRFEANKYFNNLITEKALLKTGSK